MIRKELENFYINLEEQVVRPLLDGMEFDRISGAENLLLEGKFIETEIWKVVDRMKWDKALGLDDFTIFFFQNCWDIVKGDLLKVFDEFYYLEEFNGHLNNAFIQLTPMKQNAKELKDFRPFSLLSSVYKIISKTLLG